MKKRILCLALVAVMIFTLLPMSAFAAGIIDTVEIKLCGDEVVDENGLLIPGYAMSDISDCGEYAVASRQWFGNGTAEAGRPLTVSGYVVYTIEVIFEAFPTVGRFIENPKFRIQKCIELLSYEVLDNGARAKVMVQLKIQPALDSFSFRTTSSSSSSMNDDGQLIHGTKLPSLKCDFDLGKIKIDCWKRDGEFIDPKDPNGDIVAAGHEYEVTVSIISGEHTYFDENTIIIPPKGFIEQYRIPSSKSKIRIVYKIIAEPTRIIDNGAFVLKYPQYADDEDFIKSGTSTFWLDVKEKPYSQIDAGCKITDLEKYVDGEKVTNTAIIEEGQEYMATLRLVPYDGYKFSEDFTAECDFASKVEYSLNEDGSMNVTIVAKPATAEPVAKYLNIKSPKLRGGSPAPTCSVEQKFEIKGAEWYCVDDGTLVPEGADLQTGKVYSLHLYVATSGNHIFKNFDNPGTSDDRTAPEIYVTFNGEPVDTFYGLKSGEYAGCVCVEYTYPIASRNGPSIKTNSADVSAVEGDDVSFSVVCEGDYLNYQWYSLKDGVKTALEGENSAELTIKNVTVSQHNGMRYCCTISNGLGSVESRNALLTVTLTPFIDVKDTDYYSAAVAWAYHFKPEPITKGTDATHFSPDATCTRAQTVTFLWRAMGCPEVSGVKNPFVDVKPSDYYYKAVLWAVKNGVTQGIDATHFGPNNTVTRAQTVTFIWRADGSPAVSGVKNPFVDVKPSDYYCKAVLWAVENGITNGMSATTFGPDLGCTRGQIVTFLFRY